jgi:hypothetical protein
VDPYFVSSDSASQNVVTFVLVAVQKVLADIQDFALVMYRELLGNPSCTIFMTVESAVMIS